MLERPEQMPSIPHRFYEAILHQRSKAVTDGIERRSRFGETNWTHRRPFVHVAPFLWFVSDLAIVRSWRTIHVEI